ncbi:MAG TPA: hypothetical protein VGI14_08520 [Casimicrobiaceae bacterium]|jgi:hypothetical protein
MDYVVASEIAALEHSLRAALDDMAARSALEPDGVPVDLMMRAWRLNDQLAVAVDALEDDERADAARREAANLAAQLARLERRLALRVYH